LADVTAEASIFEDVTQKLERWEATMESPAISKEVTDEAAREAVGNVKANMPVVIEEAAIWPLITAEAAIFDDVTDEAPSFIDVTAPSVMCDVTIESPAISNEVTEDAARDPVGRVNASIPVVMEDAVILVDVTHEAPS